MPTDQQTQPLGTQDPEPMQRVLFVAEAFGGGMFEITRMQAEGLVRLGHDVAIAYGRRLETPDNLRSIIHHSVELIPMAWTERSFGAQIRAQRQLRRLIRGWHPTVVHLMSSFAGLHGAFAAGNTPTVYTPQGYAFTMRGSVYKRWAYLLIESLVASRVSAIGACSLSEGEQARSLPGASSVVVVPNGIDELNTGSPARVSPKTEPRVVGMGRPLPQRQPEACARILSTVADVGEIMWIGGGQADSPGAEALKRAAIPMTGWMQREHTLQTLGSSMVYLHWTAWDGLPLSILEAMALDVVVVASDIGPNREVLGPDQVCRTEAEATKIIRALLTDASLRDEFLVNQRLRRDGYGSDRMVSNWADVYRDLTAINA